jgi:hypothetical protein
MGSGVCTSEKQVSELRDSLHLYMDSLRVVQKNWTFNALSPVVKMQRDEVRLGDTCFANVYLSAYNNGLNGFRFQEPKLSMSARPSGESSLKVLEHDGLWSIAFKPEGLGEDSLNGKIQIATPGTMEPAELSFTAHFIVRSK